MRLYFFRHGLAQPSDDPTIPDHLRALTDEGIIRTRRASRVLKMLDLKPERLYSSPLVRARQTADILGQTLGAAVLVRDELSPGFAIAALEALTHDLGSDDDVLLVGHEPDFSEMVAELTGGAQVEMKKGGLARVDVELYHPMRGTLIWLIAPKIFDQLG
jgi:phosphohistidine phosphatase